MSQTTDNTFARESLRLTEYEGLVAELMWMVRRQFHDLNDDDGLTADDKRCLKEYYLEHFISKRARSLHKSRFPEDFLGGQDRSERNRTK
jgi:hypothetical protein